jgi:hypothetical protein
LDDKTAQFLAPLATLTSISNVKGASEVADLDVVATDPDSDPAS